MSERTKTRIILTLTAAILLALWGALIYNDQAQATVDPEANQPDYWCEPGQGIKYEPVATPFVVPAPPEGTTWTLLVLKGGTTNEAVSDPIQGQGYSHSVAENSHVILCWETAQVTTTTTTTTVPTVTTTAPSTTTTDPATTTSSSTTTTSTTVTVTTTDPPSSSTTSLNPPSTVPPTTTTPPTLPNTGAPTALLIAAGLGLLTLGGATLAGSKRRQD